MRLEQRMPPFEGVAAGQTALIKLPIGRRFHNLYLAFAGVTLAQMTEIRVMANGKVFQRFSAVERNTINMHYGLADGATASVLRIPFDRIGLKDRAQEELTAVNTNVADKQGNVIRSLTVEIDIAAAAAAPVLSMKASQSLPVQGGPGVMLTIRKDTRSPAGAGDFEIADAIYNTPVAQGLNAAFFVPSANNITALKVEKDLQNIFERSVAENTAIQTDGVRTPQAGYIALDTTENGYGANSIPLLGAQDFRYIATVDGAMSITLISEYLGVLGQ